MHPSFCFINENITIKNIEIKNIEIKNIEIKKWRI